MYLLFLLGTARAPSAQLYMYNILEFFTRKRLDNSYVESKYSKSHRGYRHIFFCKKEPEYLSLETLYAVIHGQDGCRNSPPAKICYLREENLFSCRRGVTRICAALFIRHDTLFIRLTRCVTPRRRKRGFLPAGSIFWREASCDTHPVRG